MGTLVDVISWLNQGIEAGFCSPPVCSTHDGLPLTDEEDAEFEEGFDPCVQAVRIWEENPGH